MGAWDATSFGNDAANDWAYDLRDSNDLSFINATLQNLLIAGDADIGTRDSEKAIAAAEVVAWLLGRPSATNAYTQKVATWVATHPIQPPPATIQKALAVLDRVECEPSSLLELWDGDSDWVAAIAALRTRLSP